MSPRWGGGGRTSAPELGKESGWILNLGWLKILRVLAEWSENLDPVLTLFR
eukprot:CAMPEP_0184304014 /NCGR_PEP_ID=MMETSP1049-20130417/13649_1 /TAXON_ID=77928 /ORGANISM="Proteomonas sulcata, Strain CCMP704" /LENGTH=50 /DNA_ID=CAMNT_0026615737 /DNA_START=257 /DNA_END=409 /DNA_ORIENTATION=-